MTTLPLQSPISPLPSVLKGYFQNRSAVCIWEFVEFDLEKGNYNNNHNNDEENPPIKLICPNEPIANVIIYTIELSPLKSEERIRKVMQIKDSVRIPWSKRIADELFCGSMIINEEFESYLDRYPHLTQYPPTYRQLAWIMWDNVRYMQRIHDVDLFDDSFIREIIITKRALYTNFSPSFSWKVFAETLPHQDDKHLLAEKFLFIERMKAAMKRYRVLECTDEQLVAIQFSNIKVSLEAFEALQKEGVIEKTKTKKWTFKWKTRNEPIRPGEPIDYSVDLLSLPPLPSSSSSYAFCTFPPPRETRLEQFTNKPLGLRMFIPREFDRYACIQMAIEKKEKILYVFGTRHFSSTRIFYETRVRDWYTMIRKGNPEEIVFVKRNDQTYKVVTPPGSTTNGGTVELTSQVLWRNYAMFQTCCYDDIRYIQPNVFDVVVFFHEANLPRRWIHFCEQSCGEKTMMVLVASHIRPSCWW